MLGANAYTPRETTELVSRAGVTKANMRIDKIFFSSVMAGMLLSFACATLLSTNSSPWFLENAPGLIRTIAALVFPYGLSMVVLTGSDLCTGSFMYTLVAVVHRRLSVWKMLGHWFITFWGNLAGSLFVVCLITGCKSIIAVLYKDHTNMTNRRRHLLHWRLSRRISYFCDC
jgi:formate/nitrite transporter FocA (FNT family)